MKDKFPLNSSELMLIIGGHLTLYSILKEFGVDLWLCISIALSSLILISIFWSIAKLWQASENRFKLITCVGGASLYKDIIEAKQSILVTHFTTEKPTDEYVSLIVGKLKSNIAVTRIIPEKLDKNNRVVSRNLRWYFAKKRI